MSWLDDEYAPSKGNISTAYALRLAARDPFAQKGIPENVEDIIGAYAFENVGQPVSLKNRVRNVLKYGKKAHTRRAAERAANYNAQGKATLNYFRAMENTYRAEHPEEYAAVAAANLEPIIEQNSVPNAAPELMVIPNVPSPATLRAQAKQRNLAARQKSRRRRGKEPVYMYAHEAKPFGAPTKEMAVSKREKTRKRRNRGRSRSSRRRRT
jgi:hypothetical protein